MKKQLLYIIGLALSLAACSHPYKQAPVISSFDELSYPFATKQATLSNGIEISYSDEGKGEAIVFIHGLGSYAPGWKNNVSQLKENYRCIAIDLPGYGKSSKGDYPYSMTFFASVVAEFIDKLQLGKVTLAGHSMGGQISMVTALSYPEKVKSLILTAPAGFEEFDKGEKQWFREVLTPDAVKLTPVNAIHANLVSNFYNMPEDADFMVVDRIAMRTAGEEFDWYCYAITKSIAGMVDEPVFNALDDISQPVLVFYGENDNLIPNRFLNGGKTIDIAQQGAEMIKNSKLVMIPQAGHFAHFEKAEVFNEGVKEFLK